MMAQADRVGDYADPRAVKLPASVAIRRMHELDIAPPIPPATPTITQSAPLIELRDVEFGYDERLSSARHQPRGACGDRIALLGSERHWQIYIGQTFDRLAASQAWHGLACMISRSPN